MSHLHDDLYPGSDVGFPTGPLPCDRDMVARWTREALAELDCWPDESPATDDSFEPTREDEDAYLEMLAAGGFYREMEVARG